MHALVIDDEQQVRTFVADILRDEQWEVSEAESAEQAFEMLNAQEWEIVFCDVMLGGADGFAVLRRFADEQPSARVVLMTGHGSAAGALDATAFGAYDYLLKPFGVEDVVKLSRSVVRRQHELRDMETAPARDRIHGSELSLVGRSAAFVEVMKLVGRVATTNLPVLITGESGTGKEVVARAIHLRSQRATMPFIPVNCGALPSELIESELFGHVRGSFTGAERERPGLFEEADGGTVFLDEITETTHAFQVKLLRALQSGEIRRVGANRAINVDVRVIAATNRDLEAEVEQGRFRQDLLYRLNAVSIRLPALRERRDDIMPLIKHFVARARPNGGRSLKLEPEAMALLEAYDWPGNIRELENAIVRAAALCEHIVRPGDLPERVRNVPRLPHDVPGDDASRPTTEWPTLAEVEDRYVQSVLRHTGGHKQAAARVLGVDRKTLARMIKRSLGKGSAPEEP